MAAVEGRAGYDLEFRIRRQDGVYRWFQTRGVPLRDEQGRTIKWFGTCTDIDDRKRSEQDLLQARDSAEAARSGAEAARSSAEAANAAKDRFLAVLSHELRTPLTPVLSTVQAIESEPDLPESMRPSIEMIKRNVELEARLIDDLLDLTRVARGKLELDMQVADAHQAMRHAIDICRDEVGGKGLRLHAELSAAGHFVHADSARLQQVFWNLIKNAVKFTPTGGQVWIRSENVRPAEGEARLRVEVRDSGIGIEPHLLERIFDAFEQGEPSITRRFGGLGLGLSISKALIDAQGGRLTAASEGKDRGATFMVELPVVPAPLPPKPDAVRPANAAGIFAAPGVALRILLVDDHEDTARAMARLLRRLGHRVTTAHTMAEAVAEYDREGGADLLISDIGLPDGSGLELIRELQARTNSNGGSGPVRGIALSGFGMADDVRKSKDAGFFDHLTKPINFQKLEATIRAAAAK
jgi:signal transduction histidine kinase/ActR/RegA family two-component response regulator